jgi:hypothetical protein
MQHAAHLQEAVIACMIVYYFIKRVTALTWNGTILRLYVNPLIENKHVSH